MTRHRIRIALALVAAVLLTWAVTPMFTRGELRYGPFIPAMLLGGAISLDVLLDGYRRDERVPDNH